MKRQILIQNNLLYYPKAIAVIYEMNPPDMLSLPESAQNNFEQDLKQVLHSLQQHHVQIVVRIRRTVVADILPHLTSLASSSEVLLPVGDLQSQCDVYSEQLSALVNDNNIPLQEYFLVFTTDFSRETPAMEHEALLKLENHVNRVARNFARSGITLDQVKEAKLSKLLNSFTRP